MNKSILKTTAALSLAFVACLALSQFLTAAQAEAGRTLVGSWDVTVTPRDCATGDPAPFPPPFYGMQTYNLGGTMTESDAGIPGNPIKRVGGQGVWANTGGREYSLAWRVYNFNPDGSPAGKDVIRDVITLGKDGNSYSSTGTVEIYDPAGNLLLTGCATTAAARFE